MRQELATHTMVSFVHDKPGRYVPKAELRLVTSMGRFTLYPDDEFETDHPQFLIVWRNGHSLHISWDIISDIVLCPAETPHRVLLDCL